MPDRSLDRGRHFLEAGRPEKAIRAAKRFLLSKPSDPSGLRLLFEASMAAGRLDDARLTGHELLEINPDDLRSRLALGQLELAASAPDRAIEVLGPASAEDRAVAALIACAHEQLRRPQVALQYREYAQSASHGDGHSAWGEYFREQCCALLDTHTDDDLSHRLAAALREVDDDKVLTKASRDWLRVHGKSSLGVLVRTDLDLMSGRIERARKRLSSFSFGSKWMGAVANRQGDIALLSADLEEARSQFRRATVLDPKDENSWLDLIRAEMLLGEADSAIETIERARSHVASSETTTVLESMLEELSSTPDQKGKSIVGLAWTESGGALLEIEVVSTNVAGELTVTGHVDDDMQQSAQVAFECLRSRLGFFESNGAHVHFPTWEVHKHGASAGLAIAAALYSAATSAAPIDRLGLTGEVTLAGNVYPIGGLREKVTAAMLAGVSRVAYPLANRVELTSVPASIRRQMQLIPMTDVEQLRSLFS